ncbi:Lem3/Cdc50 [Suhomyces tanzawaensis NRRL Y-17324]|uniref:Lem3/Cdc50 n=1 Tax=Suhomyces tanzawaensis NRRL Y-17324 TaxID=984487 RepID=A0A1E4SCT5_9ASCO|nr:Lem3/Cdc50 [Suhomyces tanzawaensis NRRL Y-17324]ODV77319.1 Lem3/Cdc50 [Suhomyces tanzawaensis NRRL Y-17324]
MNFLRRRRASEDDDDDDVANGSASAVHKSRKPPNTAFRQQRLQAWQPILTPKSVIPLLFLLVIIFTPLGIAIIYTTYNSQTLSIDYSHCDRASDSKFENVPSKYVNYHFQHKNSNPGFQWMFVNDTEGEQTCRVRFDLPVDIKPPVYLYYKLTNFFQNHRKYVESYDLEQIKGIAVSEDSVTDNCKPLLHRYINDEKKLIYPCGLVANSFFNDTFSSPVLLNAQNGNNNETYEMPSKDISWSSDRKHKFKKTKYNPDDIAPPPNWDKMFPQGYNESNIPDLGEWELLQNWMRTAGLPSFFKLYGKNTTETLSSGTYEVQIGMNYPVTIFGGTKSMVITTNSIFGGRNMSLGIIYIVVAALSLALGVAFLVQHLFNPRRVGDHIYLQSTDATPANFRDQL